MAKEKGKRGRCETVVKRIHVQLVPAVRWIRCNADREALSLVLSMHGSACLGRQKWRWIRPAWLLPRVETMAVERAHSTRRRRSIASSARVHSIPPIVQPLLRDLAKFFWLVRSLCSHVAGATTEARAPRCRFITAMARVFELATRPRPLRPCRSHPHPSTWGTNRRSCKPRVGRPGQPW